MSGHDAVLLNFDGGCHQCGTRGPATFGFTIRRGQKLVTSGNGRVSGREDLPLTSNTAEWMGLENGLLRILTDRIESPRLLIFGDSMLVICQLKGKWRCKKPWLAACRERCISLLQQLVAEGLVGVWSAKWIPRNRNADADALCRDAYGLDWADNPVGRCEE